MNLRLFTRLAVFVLFILVLASILTAAAAANTVPSTRLIDQSQAITANNLKPDQCAALNLTGIFVCTKNTCKAPNPSELVLAGLNTNKIDGGGGESCCVGDPGITYTNCAWHP
jgi:hypothetical protein